MRLVNVILQFYLLISDLSDNFFMLVELKYVTMLQLLMVVTERWYSKCWSSPEGDQAEIMACS